MRLNRAFLTSNITGGQLPQKKLFPIRRTDGAELRRPDFEMQELRPLRWPVPHRISIRESANEEIETVGNSLKNTTLIAHNEEAAKFVTTCSE